jgi:hypothetical protein
MYSFLSGDSWRRRSFGRNRSLVTRLGRVDAGGAWDIPELEIMVVCMSLPTIDASLTCRSSSESVTVSSSPMHV